MSERYRVGDIAEWDGRYGVVQDVDHRGFPICVRLTTSECIDPSCRPNSLKWIAPGLDHDPGDEDVQR